MGNVILGRHLRRGQCAEPCRNAGSWAERPIPGEWSGSYLAATHYV